MNCECSDYSGIREVGVESRLLGEARSLSKSFSLSKGFSLSKSPTSDLGSKSTCKLYA